jgi:Protein of unknown function (DUF3726)
MTYSLNEVEAMCRRAARGAGLSWGMAEEAGKAARWLSAHSLPGPAILLSLLEQNDGTAYEDLAPMNVEGEWRSPEGRLCPLIAGAALCDRSARFGEGKVHRLGPTSHPVLLAPYAAAAARQSGRQIHLSWQGADLYFSGTECMARAADRALLVAQVDTVDCTSCDQQPGTAFQLNSRAEITPQVWKSLAALAQRTYAPATEESRISGAGSGLSDND